MTETINITRLAREFHITTTDAQKRLSRSGVSAANEVIMPSGRHFVVYDREAATEALRKAQELSKPAVRMNPPANPSRASGSLEAEVGELKAMVEALLKMMGPTAK